MKHHPKRFEDIGKFPPNAKTISEIGSRLGTVDELITLSRDFYKEAFLQIFLMTIKQAWLEHQYTLRGVGRNSPRGGMFSNKVYGYFIKNIVGRSQKPLTDSLFATAITSYIPKWFPKFYAFNPFTEPEYFKFPYDHVSIDHLAFVYQCKERDEMLAYAEQKKLSYGEFRDWAVNHVNSESPGEYATVFWHNSSYLRRRKTRGMYKTKY